MSLFRLQKKQKLYGRLSLFALFWLFIFIIIASLSKFSYGVAMIFLLPPLFVLAYSEVKRDETKKMVFITENPGWRPFKFIIEDEEAYQRERKKWRLISNVSAVITLSSFGFILFSIMIFNQKYEIFLGIIALMSWVNCISAHRITECMKTFHDHVKEGES